MIRVDGEVEAEEIAAKVAYSPDDTSRLELHGDSFAFVVESHMADKNKRVDETNTLFLFKSGAQAVDVGVAMDTERPGPVGNSVPVGEA